MHPGPITRRQRPERAWGPRMGRDGPCVFASMAVPRRRNTLRSFNRQRVFYGASIAAVSMPPKR